MIRSRRPKLRLRRDADDEGVDITVAVLAQVNNFSASLPDLTAAQRVASAARRAMLSTAVKILTERVKVQ
jgi:hypothetical protein